MQSFLSSAFAQNWLRFLYQRLTLVLILLFCSAIGVAIAGFLQLSTSLIDAQALQNAQLSAEALNKARIHYSDNAAQRVRELPSIEVTPYYKEIKGAIPNPATFAIELGELLSQDDPAMSIRLYSNYPFPNRQKTGGSRNRFEREAFAFLSKNPEQRFYRKEKMENHLIFRYAEAVTMKPSCVQCHNTLPSSPKKDWKVGDVRGVVSISQPLDQVMLLAKNGLRKILITLSSIIGLAFVGIVFVLNRLRYFNQELQEKVRQQTARLERLAIVDDLTQLYNRRHFDAVLAKEWKRLQRLQQPLSLIIADVDYFKKYNDTYGHQAGDRCLIIVATAIKQVVKRAGDLAARYGGEEFVIILPNTDPHQVLSVVELLQNKINQANLVHESSLVSQQVTMSLGIATLIPQKNIKPKYLIELADRALYEAKEKGRNRYMARCYVLPNEK